MSTHAQVGLEEDVETQSEEGWDRSNRILAWCAASGLGALFFISFAANRTAGLLIPAQEPSVLPEIPMYIAPIVSIIVLVLWKLEPVRAWSWLLVTGVISSFPFLLALISDTGTVLFLSPSTLSALASVSPVLLLVSAIGGGTWLSTRGMSRFGSVVVGASIVIQLVGAVLGSLLFLSPMWWVVRWIAVALLVLALVGGIVAVLKTHQVRNQGGPQPDWRITALGGLGVLTSVVPVMMGVEITPSSEIPYGAIGALVLGIGLVLGFVAGWRSLLSALALGSINAVLLILLFPTIQDLHRARELASALLVISLILGLVAAHSRVRQWIAVVGLTVVGTTFFLLMIGLNPESESFSDVWEIATPILVLLVVVSVVAAVATIGTVLADRGETPAVVIGLAIPVQLAGLLFFLGLQLNVELEGPPINSLLFPTGLALLLAAGALSMLVTRVKDAEELESATGKSADQEPYPPRGGR
ncbi:MAG: hypothetical protein GEU79_02535 [Acidimicrobiia bacterium]|nr:hypothetical protein [Acidimicrobiia bacterium]